MEAALDESLREDFLRPLAERACRSARRATAGQPDTTWPRLPVLCLQGFISLPVYELQEK